MTITLRISILKYRFILLLLIACVLAAVLAYPVLAKDSTTSSTQTPRKGVNIVPRTDTRMQKIDSRIASPQAKIATREAVLKAKLAKFKDRNKAEIAQRVNTNLNQINQNQTDQMQKHLDKMSVLLDKLESRITSSTPDIKDPRATQAAVDEATEMIASASAAVAAQVEKDYTIQVTSETRLKTDAQAVRGKLHQDLQAVRKLVIAAKQSVGKVIRVAKSGKETSPSGQQ